MVKLISFDFDGTLRSDIHDSTKRYDSISKFLATKLGKDYLSELEFGNHWNNKLESKEKYEIEKAANKEFIQMSNIPKVMIELVKSLSENHDLIVFTVTSKERIIDLLEKNDILKYFKKVYSGKSDFGARVKKSHMFTKIASDFQLNPSDCLHIGDFYDVDYLEPKKAGFHAILLEHSPVKKINPENLQGEISKL
jgi:HAD superfamily hydrolase (TIGR01549 family)